MGSLRLIVQGIQGGTGRVRKGYDTSLHNLGRLQLHRSADFSLDFTHTAEHFRNDVGAEVWRLEGVHTRHALDKIERIKRDRLFMDRRLKTLVSVKVVRVHAIAGTQVLDNDRDVFLAAYDIDLHFFGRVEVLGTSREHAREKGSRARFLIVGANHAPSSIAAHGLALLKNCRRY